MALFPRRRPTPTPTPEPGTPVFGPYAHPDGGPGPYWEDAEGHPVVPITGAAAVDLRRRALEHRP